MKTLFLPIFVFSIVMILMGIQNSAYAPCLIGVTNCGPPPGVTVSTWTDSGFYEKNDTINYSGRIYAENYQNPIKVDVFNYSNAKIESFDAPVSNNTFNMKIKANFDTSGTYKIVACVNAWCDNAYFKFTAAPYKLSANGQDFFIRYKSSADLEKIEADIANNALRIHVTGATSTGQQFVIELPRALIDSKLGNNDANFSVLIGMHQPDKYMQTDSFKEISSNTISRTLALDIPYEPVANSNGVWDFKITPASIASGPGFYIQSPLKQFKSGIATNDVTCQQGFQLVVKLEDGSPACLRAEHASELVKRGWAESANQSHQIQMWYSSCGSAYPIGGAMCLDSNKPLKSPQNFNMTSVVHDYPRDLITLHSQSYCIKLKKSDKIVFGFNSTASTNFTLYQVNRTSADTYMACATNGLVITKLQNSTSYTSKLDVQSDGLFTFMFDENVPVLANVKFVYSWVPNS